MSKERIANERLREMAMNAYEAIFADADSVEIEGRVYPISITSRAGLRSFRVGDLLFIEQNPDKTSKWAEEARNGAQIMWVMRGRAYLARVRDGAFLDLRKS